MYEWEQHICTPPHIHPVCGERCPPQTIPGRITQCLRGPCEKAGRMIIYVSPTKHKPRNLNLARSPDDRWANSVVRKPGVSAWVDSWDQQNQQPSIEVQQPQAEQPKEASARGKSPNNPYHSGVEGVEWMAENRRVVLSSSGRNNKSNNAVMPTRLTLHFGGGKHEKGHSLLKGERMSSEKLAEGSALNERSRSFGLSNVPGTNRIACNLRPFACRG